MSSQPKQASSATMAIVYITLGALTVVWTVVHRVYLKRYEAADSAYLWNAGFFFSGLVLMGIGFFVGRIGRSARQAEVAAVPSIQVVPTPGTVQDAPATAAQPSGVPAMAPAPVAPQPPVSPAMAPAPAAIPARPMQATTTPPAPPARPTAPPVVRPALPTRHAEHVQLS